MPHSTEIFSVAKKSGFYFLCSTYIRNYNSGYPLYAQRRKMKKENYGFRQAKGWTAAKIIVFFVGLVVSVGCSGGGGGGQAAVDTSAPRANILFPPSGALTDGQTLKVYGTASDNGAIASVRVNGMAAQTSDGYSNWETSIPLTAGWNTLTVETRDASSNVNARAAEITVLSERYLVDAVDIAIESGRDRALILDRELRAVLTMDLFTGALSVLSDNVLQNTLPLIASPRSLTLDESADRALVMNGNALVTVDLANGARSVLSDNVTPTPEHPFSLAYGVAADSVNNRALVTDPALGAVLSVDLSTGARSVLSDNTTPDSVHPIEPYDIVVDPANNRALVINKERFSDGGWITAVDLTTGERNVFFDGTISNGGLLTAQLQGMTIDSANNRVLVTESGSDKIIAIDLTTGEGLFLPDHDTLYSFNIFALPAGIAVDSANNRVLITNQGEIIEADLTTGRRTAFSGADIPFYYPASLEFDSLNHRVLVTDVYMDKLVAVDLLTGSRTSFFDKEPQEGPSRVYPHSIGIALDSGNNRVFAADGTRVISVNLQTGAPAQSFDGADYGVLGETASLAWDAANNRVLVMKTVSDAIYSLDLATGEFTLFSSNTVPNMNTPFSLPLGIDLDPARNRALVTDLDLDAVMVVDLNTGARSVLSDSTMPNNPALQFHNPWGIRVDANNNRALVPDGPRIFAVDLNTGIRTQISGGTVQGLINLLYDATDIAVDGSNGVAYVTDSTLNAVVAVYLKSGDRVIISK
jgi:hypothetical protein